ncbi:hypothetical protein ACFL2E_05025 [Thermodesulfobacteriota bacterium]
MPKRLTIEFIKSQFRDNGCKLLATEYINSSRKMPYICSCGNTAEISWSNFHNGQRCIKCGHKRTGDFHRFTLDYVREYFKSNNCILLATEYKNTQTKMPFVCSCGNKSEIRFGVFRMGQRCKKCGQKKVADKRRLSFETVKATFEKAGCVLLENEYINIRTKMRFICSCGREYRASLENFRKAGRCKTCSGLEKPTFEFVEHTFEKEGCTLLEAKYINSRKKMKYICSCGNRATISWEKFNSGQRCKICGIERTVSTTRLTYDFVKSEFKKAGCVLLENEYKNAHTKMNYICSCGNNSSIAWLNFIKGVRCDICGEKKRVVKSRIGGIRRPYYNHFASWIAYADEVRRDPDDKRVLQVKCKKCHNWFIPTKSQLAQRKRALEGKNEGELNLYCSDICKNTCSIYKLNPTKDMNDFLYPNSSGRDKYRAMQIWWSQQVRKKYGDACEKCGSLENVDSHHINPYAISYDAMHIDNGVRLCEECHYQFAHQLPGCSPSEIKQYCEGLRIEQSDFTKK